MCISRAEEIKFAENLLQLNYFKYFRIGDRASASVRGFHDQSNCARRRVEESRFHAQSVELVALLEACALSADQEAHSVSYFEARRWD